MNEVASDHDALDLGGAVDDLEHLRERDESCERIVVEPPVGAERLAALDRGAECGASVPEALRVGDRDRASFLAEQLRRLQGQPSCRLEIGGDVGKRPGHPLMCVHGLAEDGSLARVPDCDVERLGVESVRDRGDVETGHVDRPERRGHALAWRDEQVGGCVVELEVRDGEEIGCCLAIRLAEVHAGIVGVDDEERDVTVDARPPTASVFATTRSALATPPSVTQAFVPLTVQASPSLRPPRRDRCCFSEPAWGSVRSNPPSSLPETSDSTQRSRRASSPTPAIAVVTALCIEIENASAASPRPSSSKTSTACGKERPRPPSAGATKSPVRPESPTASRG